MPEHRVLQGQSVRSIAWAHGVPWDEVWEHPDNDALRERRRSPDALCPGDVLAVFEPRERVEQRATDQTHRFKVNAVPFELNVRILELGEALGGVAYELDLGTRHALRPGTTDGNGWVREPLPPDVRRAVLRVHHSETRIDEYTLAVRTLDPIEELRGVQARLDNLGYGLAIDGEFGPSTSSALAAFQSASGLEPSGEIDDATRDALVEAYGG